MKAPPFRPIRRGWRGRLGRSDGLTLLELMITITAIAIMAGIAVVAMGNLLPVSREAVATKNLEDLNQAILGFNQANWELALTADPTSSADELEIFRSLQYRSGTDPAPGSPYLNPMYAFVESSDAQTYRAVWNGRMFELVSPGTAGIGLDLLRMTENHGEATFVTGYRPVGAP